MAQPQPDDPNVSLAVVAIGRNEGERLRRCLASLAGQAWPAVAQSDKSSRVRVGKRFTIDLLEVVAGE